MKILWVSASPIGPAGRILGEAYAGSSGSWIQTIYEELSKEEQHEMSFLCFSKSVSYRQSVVNTTWEGTAYCLPMPSVSLGRKAPDKLKKAVQDVIDKVNPDIIHIWGTETCVQNVVAYCSEHIPKVVFIQGIIGIHDRYHNGDLSRLGIRYKRSVKERLRAFIHDRMFHRQVAWEAEEFKRCGNVIVDNEFSIAYCKSIDPAITPYRYHLNPNAVFYDCRWSLDTCDRHRIFTVFGAGQDKGLHQLLRALAIVKREIPDVKLYIPGNYRINRDGKAYDHPKAPSFQRLMVQIIKEHDLFDNVVFCGRLTQQEMAKELEKAHIYVNPSVMEVHAASLREAMTVGTPSVSTYCGSVGEYVTEGKNGLLYRFEEHEVLAGKIVRLFSDDALCVSLSEAEKQTTALSTDVSLTDIYKQIIEKHQNNGGRDS